MHPCAYLLENVPTLGDFRPLVLARWQQIMDWIDKLVHANAPSIGSQAHQFHWMWTNLTPSEVI
jgi:hypothetical protein